jgi:hypothetical protein
MADHCHHSQFEVPSMLLHQTASFVAAHAGAIVPCQMHPDRYIRAGDAAAEHRAHESAAESCAAGAIGFPEKALHEAIDDVIRAAPPTCELCATE